MRVLVTGGTGYVGTALRKRLLEEGHTVRLLVRERKLEETAILREFEISTGDILDTSSCLKACEKCDAVVHLVGIIREYPSKGITFEELHVTAAANIVEAARMQGVKRFIYVSALGTGPNAVSRYHKTKFAAEQIVSGSSPGWTIIRPSVIFNPDFPKDDEFMSLLVDLAGRRVVPLIGGGKALLQPVAMGDVCRYVADALKMPGTRNQIFEIGGAERISLKKIVGQIGEYSGLKPRTAAIPAVFVKPVVKLMERYPSFPVTSDQLAMLLEDNVCDTRPVEEIFRFTPASFVEALPQILEALS